MQASLDQGIFFDLFPSLAGSGGCSCCFPSAAIAFLCAIVLAVQLLSSVLQTIVPFKLGKTFFTYLSYFIHGIVALIAVAFGCLMNSKTLRNILFFHFAMHVIVQEKPADVFRCDHFRNIHGRVLELGPGPGTNFRCWTGNNNITEWVGVEPNERFVEALDNEKAKRNLTFPTSTVWLRGEDLDVAPESFDFVVGAHVLCSVDSTPTVLQQVKRALKPGGQYLFFEHVASNADSDPANYYLQLAVQPFLYFIGNGCQFKRLWRDLSPENPLFSAFDVTTHNTSIPLGLPFLAPHVVGRAVKR